MKDYLLPQDAFVRSIKQNKDIEHAILLGAGASIESGIQSANDCIWEWKKDIFISQNPHLVHQYKNVKTDTVRKSIQQWIDNQGVYPKLNDEIEYSFYAEKANPIFGDRQRYFQRLSEGKEPSLGYHLLSLLSESGMVRSVWTTNFDGLMVKAAYKNNLTPIEITLESEQRLYRVATPKELLSIALHGDYKYGPLKNTSSELDSQNDIFVSALKSQVQTRNLIVFGYSGRDKSLMNALKQAYSERGAGRLYWCGYGHDISPAVNDLIELIRANGREAYYISTDGFDKTLLNLSIACFEDRDDYLKRVEKMKQSYSSVDHVCSPFHVDIGNIHKIVKSNLLPFIFPKACFQFEVKYREDEKPWTVCRNLIKDKNITAVPHKGMVYAYGTKDQIYNTFKDRLKSDIVQTPISRKNLIDISAFQELILKTITRIFSEVAGLHCNPKNKIWDTSSISTHVIKGQNIKIFNGIKIDLFFDQRYSYISLSPDFKLPDEVILEPEVFHELSKVFHQRVYSGKPNSNYDEYLAKWKKKIFGIEINLKSEYPINSGSGFTFEVRSNNLYVGITQINNRKANIALPGFISPRQLVYKGIEYPDPQLTFYNPQNGQPSQDFHPMRGLINNQPYDFPLNNTVFRPEINLRVICPSDCSAEFYDFLNILNQSIVVKNNVDYLITYPGFISAYGIPINIPVISTNSWLDCQLVDKSTIKESALNLATQITHSIEQLDTLGNNSVIVIYIPEKWEWFTSFSDKGEYFDLHDYIKAFAVQRGISTQLIREKTLNSGLKCQIAWWLSLAFYVKSLRTPWILKNLNPDTAFAGLGYSLNHYADKQKIVLGCSHIYTADGQGLKYKLSRINDYKLDRRNNPFLSEHEAYKLGINIRELFFKSVGELPKRVVLHKRTRFTNEEITGLTQSLRYSGIENVDLVEITYEDYARFVAVKDDFSIDNFPVTRGCCFPISDNTAYLFTHGIAPSIRNPNYRYIMGGTSIPVPLKIKKHYGNSNIGQIATEILGLSKMNWNSFDLYSKLPCTLKSSSEIAKIGWLLSHYEGRTYDYRNFM